MREGVLILYIGLHFSIISVCLGTIWTQCHERHFWVTIESSFLGEKYHFTFESYDRSGFSFSSDRDAPECGYTALLNHLGDLVFRASFLACHVTTSKNDKEYHLNLWFVNHRVNGTVSYPLRLYCALQWPWGAREIACEENYMEVSVQRPILPVSFKAQPDAEESEMGVMFHGAGWQQQEAGTEHVMSRTEAANLGYLVSQSGSRLLLRTAYSSPLSYTVKEKGVNLEIVSATILQWIQGTLLASDATVACNKNEATVDGSDLLWSDPHAATLLASGRLRDVDARIGVGTLVLSTGDFRERGYRVSLAEGLVELRVPIAAPGSHVKSGVVKGQYGQVMTLDLFFMRQWQDQRWPLTQHRFFRRLHTPFIPRTPFITDNTVPSEGVFNITLGCFPSDVSLKKVMVGGKGTLWTWDQSKAAGSGDPGVTMVSHHNGSHSYRLNVPFAHSDVVQKYEGGGYKKYSLPLTFELKISPRGEVFHHQATVESSVEEPREGGALRLEGRCLDRSLQVLLHHGVQDDLQWELFLGARRLDWELVEMGGYRLEEEDDFFSVEIPLQGPGMVFEELTLQRLVARAEVSVVHVESLEVQDQLVQRCTFPVGELLICLPEGRIVAVVDTTHSIPPVQPNRTTLVDPSCVPVETDSARALFIFNVDACGTTITTKGSVLIYENQVIYHQGFLPWDEPVIQRDSPYRLTIQCRYPANDTSVIPLPCPRNPTPDLSRTRRGAICKGNKDKC